MPKIDTTKIQQPQFMTRALAGAIDLSLVVFCSVFGSSLAYIVAKNSNGPLKNTIAEQTEHTASSHLVKPNEKGELLTYSSDDYFVKTENGYQIIDALSYFYTVYLAGDSEKASVGDIVAPNANDEVIINEIKTTPHAYYTVEWFNNTVLELPKESQTPKNDYFVYQKNADDTNDYSKVGTINEKYINDGVVEAPEEMVNFIYSAYKEAAQTLYDQSYMQGYTKYVNYISSLISFICRLSFVAIFLIIIPLAVRGGKSLGKLAMRISLVKFNGEPIGRWQVLPRGILYLIIPFVLFFVPNLFVQIGIVAAIIVADTILYFVDKEGRLILHDLISQTVVAEDPKINK